MRGSPKPAHVLTYSVIGPQILPNHSGQLRALTNTVNASRFPHGRSWRAWKMNRNLGCGLPNGSLINVNVIGLALGDA